jgi:hypothetical protein
MSPFKKSHSVIQWVRRRRCGSDFFYYFRVFSFIRSPLFYIFPRYPDKNFPFAIRFEPLVNWISRV